MTESVIHKGLILDTLVKPGYARVWIPTGKSTVPDGFSEYMYRNTGGTLYGNMLDSAHGSSYLCKIASPLTAGAWFRALETKAVSVFDDFSDTAVPLPLMANYQGTGNNGVPETYNFKSDNPAATGSVSCPTLSVAGGNSTHKLGNIPKGEFPVLKPNQWVLIAFIHSSSNPVIIASLHSDEAWSVIQK